MIQIRLTDHNDSQRWNDYVRRNSDASPYHLIAWKLATEAAYQHEQFYLIAEQQGTVVGVLPVCLLAFPLMRGALCSLPYCDIGGCLAENEEVKQRLLDEALKIASRHMVPSLQIRTRAAAAVDGDPEYTGKVSMLLPLPDSSEELFLSFKSKLRSQIRKAEKNGLMFHAGRDIEELEMFYRVLSVNMRDLGSPVHSLDWFKAIRREYANDMVIGIVSNGNVPVSAGMLLFLEDKAAIPWASTLQKYNHLAPNMLLYWRLLEIATDKHCEIFDFGRSSYGEGSFNFKKQWGARPVPLIWKNYKVNGRTMENETGRETLRKLVEAIWRRLPLPVANMLGPVVRKYISL